VHIKSLHIIIIIIIIDDTISEMTELIGTVDSGRPRKLLKVPRLENLGQTFIAFIPRDLAT